MSQENVEIVRKLFDAANRGDFEAALALLHPTVEWDTTSRGIDGGIAHGRQQVEAAWSAWLDTWKDVRIEVLRVVADREHVVARLGHHAHGRLSGIEGDWQWIASFKVEDGLVTYYRDHRSWQGALEAAGLSE